MTIPACGHIARSSTDIQEDAAALDLDRIGRQIDADRRALGRAGAKIKAPVMLGAFDDRRPSPGRRPDAPAHACKAVGREIAIVVGPVDRESPRAMIETDHVFLVDVVRRAGVDPASAMALLLDDRRVIRIGAGSRSFGGDDLRIVIVGNGLGGRRQFALHEIAGVAHLPIRAPR